MDQLYDLGCNTGIDSYKDNIWCDVVTMDISQVILRWLWLFDKDIIIHGRSNMCQFEYEDKKIKLLSFWPKPEKPNQKPTTPKKTNGVNLVSAKDLDQELKNGAPSWSSLQEKWLRKKIALSLQKLLPWLKSLVMSSWKTT